MAINNTNLYYVRGDTFTFPCLAQDYQQNVINLTSSTFSIPVKRAMSDVTPLFTGTATVTSAPAGTFTVTFSAASTDALPNYDQVLLYDVQVTTSGGLIYTVQAGRIYLSATTLP